MTPSAFDAERLAQLGRIEREHFWFTARRRLVLQLLTTYAPGKQEPILDVGCGTGFFLRVLANQGYHMVGLDQRPEGLDAIRTQLPGALLMQGDATDLPFAAGDFGAVLLLDVLEHTEDQRALAEAARVLKPGGVAIIAVPAVPGLWSYRDQAAGHRRRYTRQSLTHLMAGAQLTIRDVRYYQCLLFPLVAGARLLGRRSPGLRDLEDRPLPALNALLTRINDMEVRVGDRIRWPWGSSIIAVGQKA